jgi:hypothetical protein
LRTSGSVGGGGRRLPSSTRPLRISNASSRMLIIGSRNRYVTGVPLDSDSPEWAPNLQNHMDNSFLLSPSDPPPTTERGLIFRKYSRCEGRPSGSSDVCVCKLLPQSRNVLLILMELICTVPSLIDFSLSRCLKKLGAKNQ